MYESGEYEVALNRAYYCAFDAMRAINALDGFDSSKHSGVIAHFYEADKEETFDLIVKVERFLGDVERFLRGKSIID